MFDNLTGNHCFREHNPLFIIGDTCKDFVRTSVIQTDKGNPFLLVILETNHIGIQFHRSFCRHFCLRRGCLFFIFVRHQDTGTRTVPIDRTSLASALPSLDIKLSHQFLGHIRRQVDGNADGMVHPFLHLSLHPNLSHPIDVIGSSFIVGRFGHQLVDFFIGIVLSRIVPVDFHPFGEFMVEYDKFLVTVARFIDEINPHILVIRIHFSSAFVDGQENGLDSRSRLGHQTGSSGRSNSQTSDITTSVLHHIRI